MLNEPIEVTLKVTSVLEKLGVAYLIGGSLASTLYGMVRTTQDSDIIAEIRPEHVQPFVSSLQTEFYIDEEMIADAIQQLKPAENAILFIENIGNLVCPAMFDLGEQKRVVIISVTEGDDKPLKYPDMFQSSQLCIINKTDLLPYVNFDVEKTKSYARRINPAIQFIELSCTSGEGLSKWYEWLKKEIVESVPLYV